MLTHEDITITFAVDFIGTPRMTPQDYTSHFASGLHGHHMGDRR